MDIDEKILERSNRRFNQDFGCEERDEFRVCKMCIFEESDICNLCDNEIRNKYISKFSNNSSHLFLKRK